MQLANRVLHLRASGQKRTGRRKERTEDRGEGGRARMKARSVPKRFWVWLARDRRSLKRPSESRPSGARLTKAEVEKSAQRAMG